MSSTEWKQVAAHLERVEVPGGWVYRHVYGNTLTFVPDPRVYVTDIIDHIDRLKRERVAHSRILRAGE